MCCAPGTVRPVRRYLDHNATTPLDPRVREALIAALDAVGNPSSVHAEGRAARDRLEGARRQVAAAIGAAVEDVVFTSGGTEADRLGVVGLARAGAEAGRPRRVVIAAVEHPAVTGAADRLAAEGFAVDTVACTGEGVIEPDALARALGDGGASCVAIALANHELGTVQPIAELSAVAAGAGALVHCDAVQALGKVPVDVGALGVDALAISAHKIRGPKGAGALWVRPGLDLAPDAPAGHQERGRRPGTEPLIAAIGLGAAAELVGELLADAPRQEALSRWLEEALLAAGARVHGRGSARVANTVNVAFEGAPGEVVVCALDIEGIAVSTGAACSSGTVAPSPVLLALGLSGERAAEAVRVSLGYGTTEDDVRALAELLPAIVARARRFAAP